MLLLNNKKTIFLAPSSSFTFLLICYFKHPANILALWLKIIKLSDRLSLKGSPSFRAKLVILNLFYPIDRFCSILSKK